MRSRVRPTPWVSVGLLNRTIVHPREVFADPLKDRAAAVIVAHNHPSSDTTPSPDDVAVTRAIVQAGKLLDISVLDHLVIGKTDFVSLKQRGLGFS